MHVLPLSRFAIRALLVFCLCLTGKSFLLAQSPKSEILWDTYGVPHVFANNDYGAYYGFGWAQMQNHGNLLLRLYGQARGKAAEYWGQNSVSSDNQVLLFNVPGLGEKAYVTQNPEFRKCIDAFVKGVNAYAASNPDAIGADMKRVLPVTGPDVMAHCIRALYLRFVGIWDLNMTQRLASVGSNSFAIGPSRSSSKNAMLVANPHLPWVDLYTWFEAHLQSPGFNAYGASLVGLPVLNIAFNDRLGWTHTVNTIDASDRYELALQGDGYVLDGQVTPFDVKTIAIKVRQQDGSLKEETLTLRYSKHGPVVAGNKTKAFAVRIAGMENVNVLYQWWQMARAKNLAQFETALRLMQLPMFNVIYADGSGNILYLFDGTVPKRAEGGWDFWHTTVSGDKSKYIWNETLPYDSLPRLLNPQSGFLQNANDPPWTCTYPLELDPANYPSYIAPRLMDFRPQRAVQMIRKDKSITFEELIGYKMDTRMETADRFLDDLLAAANGHPDPDVIKAAAVLKQWDRSTDAGSRGAVLFASWFDKMHDTMFARQWDMNNAIETPSGLKYPKSAVELLSQSAKEVIKNYDSLNVAWGDVYRLRMNKFDFPSNGGDGKYGIYRVVNYRRDNKQWMASGGDSYVAITEFGKKVKARVLLSYGNASQPGHKHAGDQLELLSKKQLRTAWLTREEIMKNLEKKEDMDIQELAAAGKLK